MLLPVPGGTPSWYQWDGGDLTLYLRIQPRASRDEFAGPYGDRQYRIRITAPPVDGKANQHLMRFLAKAFGVAKSRVELLSGGSGRDKVVRIPRPVKFPIPEIDAQ
ncbi:MAG TPA: YggU family protein [Gammaproteobacteria bacterium]|nr:YggU family protein [Gammaproteobacteria bacterium]